MKSSKEYRLQALSVNNINNDNNNNNNFCIPLVCSIDKHSLRKPFEKSCEKAFAHAALF